METALTTPKPITLKSTWQHPVVRQAILYSSVVILAAVFLYAGTIKIIDLTSFEKAITHYRLLPSWATFATARYLPPLEILLAPALFHPRWRKPAATILATLLTLFILANLTAIFRGINLECGCFGVSTSANTTIQNTSTNPNTLSQLFNHPVWPILRNGMLLGMTLGIVCMRLPNSKTDKSESA